MLLRLASILACFFSPATAVVPDVVGATGCTAATCVLANAYLRFGNGGENSVNAWGLFQQPWYFSPSASQWYKLTFNNYPLDTAVGTGTTGPNWSGATVVDLYTQSATNPVTDYSNFVVSSSDGSITVGYGKIVAARSFTILSQQVTIENTFSLGQNDSFVKITTRATNAAPTPIENMIVWVGTRDDYVGTTDVNTKTRGNLDTGSFVAVTTNDQSSRAIMITNTNEGVLFYSETSGVMTSYALCCSFSNAYNTNPLTLAPMTPNPTDGSYAAVLPIGNIATGASASIIWYYAAGATSSLATVAESVAIAQVADSTPTTTPTMTPTPTLTPSFTPSFTSTPTPSASSTSSPTAAPTDSPSPSSTSSPSPTQTPSETSSQTPTESLTQTTSESPTQTVSPTQTTSNTSSLTPSPTQTSSNTSSPTSSPTQTSSNTSSQTASQTASQTPPVTPSPLAVAAPTPLIVNIYEGDNTVKYDPMIYLYIFLPINIVIAVTCCIGVAVLIYKKRKTGAEKKAEGPSLQLREAWAPTTEHP